MDEHDVGPPVRRAAHLLDVKGCQMSVDRLDDERRSVGRGDHRTVGVERECSAGTHLINVMAPDASISKDHGWPDFEPHGTARVFIAAVIVVTAAIFVGARSCPSIDFVRTRVDEYFDVAAAASTPDVNVHFTGQSPISHELIDVAQRDLQRAESVGLPIAVLILLVAFGSGGFSGLGLGVVNKLLEPEVGAVMAKIVVLAFLIIFIQKRPRGLFALKGRAVEA